jgi:hypothetical protein
MLPHIFPPLECLPEDRATLAKSMIDKGIETSAAHETADLALHAATEAMKTLETVAARGSDCGVQFQAVDIAMQILRADLHRKDEMLRKAARNFGFSPIEANLTLKGD